MDEKILKNRSLDELAAAAVAGDTAAESALFSYLHVRFSQIAKRRVRRDDLDDLVQESLRIVTERFRDREDQRRTLPFSLAVLRNVIGNYYQRRKTSDRGEVLDERRHGFFLATTEDVSDRVKQALNRLASEAPRCERIFRRILESLAEGGGAREVSGRAFENLLADGEEISRSAYYVALHRCRERLRGILAEMESAGL